MAHLTLEPCKKGDASAFDVMGPWFSHIFKLEGGSLSLKTQPPSRYTNAFIHKLQLTIGSDCEVGEMVRPLERNLEMVPTQDLLRKLTAYIVFYIICRDPLVVMKKNMIWRNLYVSLQDLSPFVFQQHVAAMVDTTS